MELIKKLRTQSGAGMVDCKKALTEADNNIDKALEILRKRGIAKAAKRSDREANEGIIKLAVSDNAKKGYILQINSETDFVARNDQFQNFSTQAIELAKQNSPVTKNELLDLKMKDGNSIKENLERLSGVIGEKLSIEKYNIINTTGTIAAYSHADGKIGVLVALDKNNADDLARDIAMQIAATNPRYITSNEVPEEEINKEKEIYKEQLLKEGKPENIIENILNGKINKYFSEICLINQEFIKEEKKKISELLENAKVEKMIRYSLS